MFLRTKQSVIVVKNAEAEDEAAIVSQQQVTLNTIFLSINFNYLTSIINLISDLLIDLQRWLAAGRLLVEGQGLKGR
jgi:hypothetical protein